MTNHGIQADGNACIVNNGAMAVGSATANYAADVTGSVIQAGTLAVEPIQEPQSPDDTTVTCPPASE
ncbi:hypothetical protein [Actinokineospora inagensis]|uniref:hypothetical protein n=1 Tax=Actinokineospora inagensis TaxID=103730 RepID=UPI00040FFEAE|nr:hypothetical protein [Actinokineospora inagensis]